MPWPSSILMLNLGPFLCHSKLIQVFSLSTFFIQLPFPDTEGQKNSWNHVKWKINQFDEILMLNLGRFYVILLCNSTFSPFSFKADKNPSQKTSFVKWSNSISRFILYIFYNLQFGTMNQVRYITNKNLFIYVPKPERTLTLRKYSIREYLLNESPLFTFRQST